MKPLFGPRVKSKPLDQPLQWRVRKTFVELAEVDDCSDEEGERKSLSDSELPKARPMSSQASSGSSREEVISDLQEWQRKCHKVWSSEDSLEHSSRAGSKISKWTDEEMANPGASHKTHKTHKTWLSSSEPSLQQDSEKSNSSTDGIDKSGVKSGETYFNLPDALRLHRELMDITDSGANVRDAIAARCAHLDIRTFLVPGENGEFLSIGSALHLTEPFGTFCKPCNFYLRGNCHRSEQCLFCHYYHVPDNSRVTPKSKKPGSTKAKERRDRRKRCAAKLAKAKQAGVNAGRLSDCGSDDEADDDDDVEDNDKGLEKGLENMKKHSKLLKKPGAAPFFEEDTVNNSTYPLRTSL
jgi:hypothetical protein